MELELTVANLLGTLADAYREEIVDRGEQPLLVMLVAFGATFGITRFITHSIRSNRFSWLGNLEAGDTHIHHLVWGIILLLVAGILAIVIQPPLEVTAIVFGIGAALTLDEFALWLHLDDVYWSEKGRQSVDAVIVFSIVTGFMLVGGYPIIIGGGESLLENIELLLLQVPWWTFAVICFLKGKLIWGVVGIYVGPVALIGAIRLAKPHSWWARRRYEPEKLERSHRRYGAEEEIHRPVEA
jgi:lysyl-tRNA synthetase, class II